MNRVWETLTHETTHMLKRTLRRPGFTLISSVTLGLALGASVLAFAILYGYLFRPLPYAAPRQLLVPRQRLVKAGLLGPQVSVKFYHELAQLPEFHGAGLFTFDNGTVVVNGHREYQQFIPVTPSTFTLLGVKPLLGRALSDASGKQDGPHEVVLSYSYWQTAFGGKSNVLGKVIEVNGSAMQVVGVMPRNFVFPIPQTAFWTAFVITPALAQDDNINYEMLIRIPPGWSLVRVNAFLRALRDRELQSESPSDQARASKQGYVVDAIPYRRMLLSYAGGSAPLWGLFAITLMLLFLATLNSMTLALARQRQRVGELQLRKILGAGHAAILRMTVSDYLPVLVGMGVIAAGLASYCIAILHSYQLPSPFMPFKIRFDSVTTIYLFIAAIIVILCIAGTAVTANFLSRPSANVLQELAQHGSASRAFRITQRVLAAAQIGIALILIICSVLLSQSLIGLLEQPLNFETQKVTVASVMLPQTTTPQRFWRQSQSTFNNLPGTEFAGLSNMVPFGENFDGGEFYPTGDVGKRTWAWMATVSNGFFNTMGIHLLAGRLFGPSDAQPDSKNVIVSAALARAFFGRANVVGRTLDKNLRIIGVVPTIPWQLDPASDHQGYAVYVPIAANTAHMVQIVIKSSAALSILLPAIRRAVAATAPHAAIYRIHSLPQIMQQASLNRAALTWVVVGFGALAFLIAVFGVYAIVAYSTRLRLFEFAIRQVLGASRSAILALTLRETALLLLVGGVIGMVLAFVIAQGLRSLLYGVGTLDPLAYLGSLALIGVAVFCAAFLPAWRSTSHNPADIMRE